MGIFDVFKIKMGEAAEKVGDAAEQARDKVSDMMEKRKGDAAHDPAARTRPETPAADADFEAGASDMVSEGAPVTPDGEQARDSSGGGMTQTIKDNVAKGAEKAGEMAKGATKNRYDEKIDSAVRKAKDKLN